MTNTDNPSPTEASLRAQDILESITDAFFALDHDWCFTYVNDASERVMARKREELLGRCFWDEFPAAVGSAFEREYRRAVEEQVTVTFEEFYAPLRVWVEVRAYPSSDGLSVFYQDVSARKGADEALRRSRQDLRLAVDAAQLGTFYCDWPLDKIVWNDICKSHFFLPPDAEVDFSLFYALLHPDDREPTRKAIDRAFAERVEYNVEYRTLAPDGRTRWVNAVGRFYYDDAGSPLRFDGITRDVSERKAAEEEMRQRAVRDKFLAELAERARLLTDPDAVIADAVYSVGRFLGAARCVFADIDIEADACTVLPDYCADDGVASMAGTFPISDFGPYLVDSYRAGRTVTVHDVRQDLLQVPADYRAAYEAIACRAFVAVPVLHSARLVSVLAVHSSVPRHWKAGEVKLLQTVVERTWLTVEVLRQDRLIVREAETTTRILESIADAFFTVDRDWHYTYINQRVEAMWGRTREELLGMTVWEAWPEAVGGTFDRQFRRAMDEGINVSFEEFFAPLDAWLEVRANPSPDGLSVFFQNVTARKQAEEERTRLANANSLLLNSTGDGIYGIDMDGCFTFVNQSAAQMLGFTPEQTIGRSAHALVHHTRPDGSPYPESACPIQHALHDEISIHVEDDVFWRADGTSFPVAYSASPILEQNVVRGAVVTFSDIAERKALDAERERLALREHNIAQQLQQALQPELPGAVPGLAVTKYYEAALAEAGVGGDFYDVFSVEKGRTALVVGDLSGKGLAAAAQVSIVRNMLRAFLYTKSSGAEAVTELNRVLTENNLLTGFATLYVGCYDAATSELVYVNCGQEPALVRRAANGGVEQLLPTGPVLGAVENACYAQNTVTLLPGDALAIFTDGATECGLSRREMLGVEGVTSLLRLPFTLEETEGAAQTAEAVALRLVQGIDTASQGGLAKDDICILVAVAEDSFSGLY